MNLVKVKEKKITAGDIQRNIRQIRARMNYANNEIEKKIKEIEKLEKAESAGEDIDVEEMKEKQLQLSELNELYSVLQKEMKEELEILRKYKDSKFYIQPKDAVIIGGVAFIAVFMIALERENPKALKLATFLLKLFPIKI